MRTGRIAGWRVLAGFRGELYCSLGMRRDVLFEVCDALACRPERVHMLAELCLEPECRRGHGGVYDALNCGEVRIGRLRRALSALPLPAMGRRADPAGLRREQLAAAGRGDQPGAAVLPLLRARQGERADDPGLAVLLGRGAGARAARPGRCRWTRSGSARPTTPPRSPPRRSGTRSRGSSRPGTGSDGDPDIIVVLDSGYDLTRLAWLLDGLPVDVTGRLRADRVMYFPVPPRAPGANGRPPRHGARLDLSEPLTWPDPAVTTFTETARYGTATATAWGRLHQQLARRAAWDHHEGELPVIEGTLIRLAGRSPARPA